MCVERSVALSKKIRGPDSQGYMTFLCQSTQCLPWTDSLQVVKTSGGFFFLFADPPHLNLIPLDQFDSL